MIAALFVETNGCYFGLPNVEPWDRERDARNYAGPHSVVAHPPCKRWGRFFHGSTRKPHQYRLGADQGTFYAALWAVRTFGGVLEHPADSRAWAWFKLRAPSRKGGWIAADDVGGFTCYVEQGFYGHFSRKPTWLYAAGVELPELRWGEGEQRLHPVALAKHGYEKARRIGMTAMIGGKDKERIRDATPAEFRDVLLLLAGQNLGGAKDHDADAVGNHVSFDNIAKNNVDARGVPPFVAEVADLVVAPVRGEAAVRVGLQTSFHFPKLADADASGKSPPTR